MYQKADNISRIILNAALTFFVAYSVLQSTAISLKLSNAVIISIVFILLLIQLFFATKAQKIAEPSKSFVGLLLERAKIIDLFVAIFFIVNMLWIFIVPSLNGFTVRNAIREAGMLFLFILYFPLALLIRFGRIKVQYYVKVFYWSVFALAWFHILLWVAEAIHPGAFESFLAFLNTIHIFKTSTVISGWGITRIAISNSVLLGIGLLLSVSNFCNFKKYIFLTIPVFTFSVLCTYLRSIWYGVLFGLALLLLYIIFFAEKSGDSTVKAGRRDFIKRMCILAISILLFDTLIFHGTVLNRVSNSFNTKYQAPTSSQNQSSGWIDNGGAEAKDRQGIAFSNDIKMEQTKKLISAWEKKPLTGYGYGSCIKNYLRSKTEQYNYEMTTFALLMKLGMIGLLPWLLLALVTVVSGFRNMRCHLDRFFVCIALFCCFALTIQTNPLLFSINSLSFMMYLILFVVSCEPRQLKE